jgi:hypothetical protein
MAHHGQQLIIRWTRQSKTAPRSFLISSESNRTIKDFFKFIISIHRGLTGIIKDIFLENKRDKGAHVFLIWIYKARWHHRWTMHRGVYFMYQVSFIFSLFLFLDRNRVGDERLICANVVMTTLLLHSQVREQLAPGQTPPGRIVYFIFELFCFVLASPFWSKYI